MPCFIDVKQFNITFPLFEIPAQVTTLRSMMFEDFPEDLNQEFHIIATSPKVDNPGMIHHFKLYGCTDRNGMDIDNYALKTQSVNRTTGRHTESYWSNFL